MKKKFSAALQSRLFPVILLIFAVLAPFFSYGARSSWVFVNITVKFDYFTLVVLSLMIANAVCAAVLSALRLYEVNKNGTAFYTTKGYTALLCTTALFTLVFTIAGCSFMFGMLGGENTEVYTLYLQKSLPKAAVLTAMPALVIFFPKLPKKAKIGTAAVILSCTALFLVNSLFPLTPYKITSEPTVFDNGEGYSVVFSTSDVGTAYIEYTFDGKEYKVYDATGGKINTDKRIHSIQVPYEHLKNNTYTVGTVRVIESYSYGSRLGKEIMSQPYTLTVNESENQNWLVLSDWHTMLEEAYAAVSYLDPYDAVILLGDSSPGVDFEKQVVTNTVQFAGELTKGSVPVLYVRGNHETRGDYASKISGALGLDEFYYTADCGPYSFVILDSGEDKDDSHPEYGGTTDYNTYRANMIEWLKGVQVENKKVISLSHSWRISDVEEDLSDAGWKELNRLGVRLMISGHTHQNRLIGDGSDRERAVFTTYPDIVGYMDGGKSGENYIASFMTLSPDGIHLVSCDKDGNFLFDESLGW